MNELRKVLTPREKIASLGRRVQSRESLPISEVRTTRIRHPKTGNMVDVEIKVLPTREAETHAQRSIGRKTNKSQHF